MRSVETELEHVHIDPAFVIESKDVTMADTIDEPSTSSPTITTKLRILAKPVSPVRGNLLYLFYDVVYKTDQILSYLATTNS